MIHITIYYGLSNNDKYLFILLCITKAKNVIYLSVNKLHLSLEINFKT